jgi:L,D-transpeptidase catalytic domain
MSLLRGVRWAAVSAGISAVMVCGGAVAAQSTPITKGKAAVPFAPSLKAGEYLWYPEASPAGPLVIIISVPEQSMHVYRNGVRIGRSSISSGTSGHRTPTGVFTILEKHVKHVSSIYKGAQMPHMQRLTWRGVAMHAGYLPGYPASHGCVRLPAEFAEKLYAVTTIGSTVIVVDHKSAPTYSTRPGLIFSAAPAGTTPVSTAAGFTWTPEKSPAGPISIVVSAADHLAYVYRNGLEIGRVAFPGELSLTGAHVYSALASTDAEGRRDWITTASVGGQPPELRGLSGQLGIAPEFISHLRPLIEPGTTLVLTAASVNGQTQSKPGFKILSSEGPRERKK